MFYTCFILSWTSTYTHTHSQSSMHDFSYCRPVHCVFAFGMLMYMHYGEPSTLIIDLDVLVHVRIALRCIEQCHKSMCHASQDIPIDIHDIQYLLFGESSNPRWFASQQTSISSLILGFRTDRKILVFSILSWILIQYLDSFVGEMVRTFNLWNPTTYPWVEHTPFT